MFKSKEGGDGNRRKRDRVAVSSKSTVLVAIIWSDNETEYVTLVDTSTNGLKFRLKERSLTALKMGQEVQLTVRLDASTAAIQITAIVRRIEEEKTTCAYACELTDKTGLVKAGSPRLWELFNRRGSFRVKAPSGKTCPIIKNVSGGKMHKGELLNISTDGLAMRVSIDSTFEIGQSAKLTFELLKSMNKFVLAAEVVHQSTIRGNVVLGLQFAPNSSETIERQLIDYVNARQIVMIGDRDDD